MLTEEEIHCLILSHRLPIYSNLCLRLLSCFFDNGYPSLNEDFSKKMKDNNCTLGVCSFQNNSLCLLSSYSIFISHLYSFKLVIEKLRAFCQSVAFNHILL